MIRLVSKDVFKDYMPEREMNTRYLLGHQLLPDYTFRHKLTVAQLLRKKGAMEQFVKFRWGQAHEILGIEEKEEFELASWYTELEGNKKLTVIKMPEPKEQLDPSYIAFVSTYTSVERYFTLELGFEGLFIACEWTPKGDHINYGPIEQCDEIGFTLKIITMLQGERDTGRNNFAHAILKSIES